MPRVIEPELLDALPSEDPRARRSRRDLRVINRVMGNHRWLQRTLRLRLRTGERVVELGAGAGDLGRELARHGIAADGLDFCPRPADWPSGRDWHQADLRDFEGYHRYQAVVANLVLHHLAAAELAVLGRALRGGPRLLCACEPARSRHWRWFFAVLAPVLGANAVTRHDGRISIAAGFRGDELPRELGLDSREWNLCCGATVAGAYRIVAVRRT